MIPLAYIASPSYSGSTLLTFLLNAHPGIATMGELKWGAIDLKSYRCSCGNLLTECPFWRKVENAVRTRGLPFDLNRPPTDFRCRDRGWIDRVARARVRSAPFETLRDTLVAALPVVRERWPLIAAVNRAVIATILELAGGRVFCDASKDPVRLKHMIRTRDYDVRLIQLIRDVRGVANSAIGHEAVTLEHAALEWVRTHRQIERLGRLLGRERVLPLRYEDLCADVDGCLREIVTFLGLNPQEIHPDYRAVEHHILGNAMRLRAGSEIRLDEKWRSALNADQLSGILRIAGNLNRAYGYDA